MTDMSSGAFILFSSAAALAWALVRITRTFATRRGWVANVRADRWHTDATALFGGVGIAIAFLLVLSLARGSIDSFRDATDASGAVVVALVLGAIGAACAGIFDDVFHLKPGPKLAAQFGCACVFLWICGGIEITGSAPVDSVLCVLWIVTVMNALNMLDNMDGVAASAALVGFVAIALGNRGGASDSVWLSIAAVAAGSTAGFLAHNLPRARVFMGDCGSLFLGFLLATMVLVSARTEGAGIGSGVLLNAVGFAFVPLVDMTVVSIARIRRGQSPMQGGRDHTTHRLALMGLSGRTIVGFVAITSLAAAAVPLSAAHGLLAIRTAGAILAVGFVAMVGGLLRIAIHADSQEAPSRTADTPHRLEAFAPFLKVVIDVVLIAAAMNLGYLIRWDFTIPLELENSLGWSLPVAIACCVTVNALMGLYWKSWRGAPWTDLRVSVGSAVLGAVASLVLVAAFWSPDRLFSRAAMGIFVVGYPALVAAMRTALRAARR